jgi:ABC-type sugar transport system permease subunit
MTISEILIRKKSREKFVWLHKMRPLARREALTGLAFISPWLVGFLVFTLLPTIATLVFTFTNLQLANINSIQFVGLQNYATMLRDTQVGESLFIVLKFGLIALPVGIILPLMIALLMNSDNLKGQVIYRTLFYMPYILPFVAAIFVWGGVMNPETGWVNDALKYFGVKNPPLWAESPIWVYPTYVILGIWGIGNGMLIYLASLQNVPTELYDAAKVDGAGWFATVFNITLPMISPVIFYILVLSVVDLFQYFLVPLVVNNGTGRPGGATMFFNLYLYKTFFVFQNMAYGATLAWVLFAIILVITVLLFKTARFWVYYAGDTNGR